MNKLVRDWSNGMTFYVAYNDDEARAFGEELIKIYPEVDHSMLFVIYHVADNITLVHGKELRCGASIKEGLRLVKKDVISGNIVSNDYMLRERLQDPRASTAKFLIGFIDEQLAKA